ncbi:mucin-5AC-like, partial [Actinia tenebrosa]|uniref:Mucin-5AC-like n=1 Tax=Actinia tenebrosa TaxID=6105 RepID=A0A6P8HWZ9_ACTTE
PSICAATETFWTSKCNFCQCANGQPPMCQSVECGYDLGAPTACPRFMMVPDPNGGCCDVCPAGAGAEEEEILEPEVEGSQQPSQNNPTQPPTEEEVEEETVASPNTAPTTMPIHSGPNEETVAPHSTTPTLPIPNNPEEEVGGTVAPSTPTKTPPSTVPTHNNPEGVVEEITVKPSAFPTTRTTTSSATTSKNTTTRTSRNSIIGCAFLIRDVRTKFSLGYAICSMALKNEKRKEKERKELQFWDRVVTSKLFRIRRDTAEKERLVSHKK